MPIVERVGSIAQRWIESAADVLRAEPRRFPELMAKAVLARAMIGFNPAGFFASDLPYRSVRAWGDHMKDGPGFFDALQVLNWSTDGLRLAGDKMHTTERLAAHGVRHAPIIAVVGRDLARHPAAGRVPVANSTAEVLDLLASAPDGLFVKPAGGSKGEDARTLERVSDGWLFDGHVRAAGAVADRLLSGAPPGGVLVQPRLRNHVDLQTLMTGAGLGTLRVLVALTHRGPVVLSTGLRILGSDASTDNFVRGTTGNLAASVDVSSGRIEVAYWRRPDRRVLFERPTRHPLTGAQLVGVRLPCWTETIDLAKRAAAAFPELPLPGLDIAITDDGPVVMETNSQWSAEFSQLAGREGIRATLRRVWPELAAAPAKKARAAAALGIQGD